MTVSSPAKLNLFLAITGRRPDGFHELVSVVAPVNWGDTLMADMLPARPGAFTFECDDPAVPVDETNLVLKAAGAFRDATGFAGAVHFKVEKRIPMGAGLGGGSSNAAAALVALNRLAGEPLTREALGDVAARVGSDCALFLHGGPIVMRGRGERVEPLPESAAGRLRGRRVLIFKPAFGIATAWAYRQLAEAAPASYLPGEVAEARLRSWIGDRAAAAEGLLLNTMEPPAFRKFPALPLLLEQLRVEFRLAARMSGSGSACFALLRDDTPVPEVVARIRDAWGESAFVVEAELAQ